MSSVEQAPEQNKACTSGSGDARCIEQVLQQVREVLTLIDDEQYVRDPVGVFDCSIGGQVRHVLDHARAFLSAAETGALDYDERERGTDVESQRGVAINEIDELCRRLDRLDTGRLDATVDMRVLLSSADVPVHVCTTLGRELAFVLSHTVHHNAMIAAMVKTLGVECPAFFGYAPATIAFLERK
jgi:uncharacterized damage-inducible protein DinB